MIEWIKKYLVKEKKKTDTDKYARPTDPGLGDVHRDPQNQWWQWSGDNWKKIDNPFGGIEMMSPDFGIINDDGERITPDPEPTTKNPDTG